MARPKKNVEEVKGVEERFTALEKRTEELESKVKDIDMDINTICDEINKLCDEINKLCNAITDHFKEDVCDCEEDGWKEFDKLVNEKKPKAIEVHINRSTSDIDEIDKLMHNLFRRF